MDIALLKKTFAYTRFVLMTRFGMNLFVLRKQCIITSIKSQKSADYENVHLDGPFRNLHGKTRYG